ncbi:MAG: SBBP repeat-containing protein [Deltaproteobacteria bacterium]|nr:SBBP repeat-containing protein [Deltaproteobacteria bacterium]
MKIKPVQYWRLIAAFSFILFLPYPLHAKPDLVREMKGLHIPFIANMGQIDEAVAFYAKTFGGTVFVTRDGDIIYSLPKTDRKGKVVGGWVLKEEFEGSAIKHVTAEEKSPTAVSCFRGNDPSTWRGNVATYQLVNLGEVYKGIEVKLKAYGNNVEKLFYVKPGSRPDQIRVSVSGGKGIKINDAGELEAATDLGSIAFTIPFAYQEIKGKRVDIPVRYAILDADKKSTRGGHVYGFSIGSYDKTEALVIDPLLQSTYIGGSNSDYAYSIATDSSGNVYVTGESFSIDFPNAINGYQSSHGGDGGKRDAFVTKLNSGLTSIIQSTYLGGNGDDRAYAIAVDNNGNVYVAGQTSSTDFPGTAGGYGGNSDAFVAKLNSELTTIQSMYLGGTGSDWANSIAIEAGGNIYVAGTTDSAVFPGTTGGAQASKGTGFDAFVTKLDSNLDTVKSTYLGREGYDEVYSLALYSSDGNTYVYAAGQTDSTNFPGTSGGAQQFNGGAFDAFVTKLNSDLTSIVKSTYLGGDGYESAYSTVVDAGGFVYVAGYTSSTDFPGTSSGAQPSHGTDAGLSDAFVTKLNSELTSLVRSTYLGGDGDDYANAMAIDSSGNVYIAGQTISTTLTGTATDSVQPHKGGSWDAFVARLNSDLTSIAKSTFLGGSGSESAYAIAIDSNDKIYVAGFTFSINFPGTAGGAQSEGQGGDEIFVSRFDSSLTGNTLAVSKTGNGTGNITDSLAGINCGSVCNTKYGIGTSIALTASPDTGCTFVGWSGGGCSGTGTCNLIMSNMDVTVTAMFSDITSPSNGLITINSGATITGSISVALSLSANDAGGVTEMKISNEDANWNTVTAVPYSSSIAWNLMPGDGIRTVYVMFKDAAGNWSSVYSASITLDQSPPITTISGTPASRTNSTSASLTVGGADVVAYKYKLDGGVYSPSEIPAGTPISLSSLSEGSHTVYVIGKDTAGNWQAEGSATEATWTVDLTPSTATISGTPAALTNTTSVSLTVSGTDVVAYKYKLDSGIYSPLEIPAGTPISLSSLSEGSHTVYVIGKDSAGNWQAEGSATMVTWTVDSTPSTATISGMPTSRTNSTSASLNVGGIDVVAYRYMLDGGVYSPSEIPIGTPISLSSLSEGSHIVSVIGKDTTGNWQAEGSATMVTWTVDLTPSTATISGVPASRTNSTSASLTVSGTDVIAYKYKLDGGVYSTLEIPAGTPISLSSLSEGSHTVSVIGKDSAGNWQSEISATMVTWTVDLTPSTASISGAPASLTNSTSVSLTVSGTDVVAYKYKLDGGVYSASEIPIGTPISLSSLSEGSHTVSIIGKDTTGNWQAEGSATMVTWTVDLSPSTASISGMPASRTNSTSASLTVDGTDVVAYKHKLDGGVYSALEIPAGTPISLSSLSEGSHTVYVIGKDTAGNWQAEGSATMVTWTVDITPSTATISGVPASRTNSTSASLNIGGIDVVAYRYKLDGGVYSASEIPAGSPITLSSLSEGSHTVSVIGKDSAGNWQSEGSATTVTWTVDITPSTATISGMPASRTNSTSASLNIGGIDVVAYRYKLDGGVYSASEIPAGSPITLSSLSEGSHTVSVIGKDSAGNWQSEG